VFTADQVEALVRSRFNRHYERKHSDDDGTPHKRRTHTAREITEATTIVVIPPNWNRLLDVKYRNIVGQLEFIDFTQLLYGGMGICDKLMKKLTPKKDAFIQLRRDRIVQKLADDDAVIILSNDINSSHSNDVDLNGTEDNIPDEMNTLNFKDFTGGASRRSLSRSQRSRSRKKKSKSKKKKKKGKKSKKEKSHSRTPSRSRSRSRGSISSKEYQKIMKSFSKLQKRSRSRSRGGR